MNTRKNFSGDQRDSAFLENACWLRDHRVDGIEISDAYQTLRQAARIFYCENCLFCHFERKYFDIDHLVPDSLFRAWGKHESGRLAVNMAVLCKSNVAGDYGCNQTKGGKLYVPKYRGLAYKLRAIDLNYIPLADRPFAWTKG